MKKIWIIILWIAASLFNFFAMLFVWENKKRYDNRPIEGAAVSAKENKVNEIKNKSAADVCNDYLDDDSKSGVAGIKHESDKRIDDILG